MNYYKKTMVTIETNHSWDSPLISPLKQRLGNFVMVQCIFLFSSVLILEVQESIRFQSQAWWSTPVIEAFRKLRQEAH